MCCAKLTLTNYMKMTICKKILQDETMVQQQVTHRGATVQHPVTLVQKQGTPVHHQGTPVQDKVTLVHEPLSSAQDQKPLNKTPGTPAQQLVT